MTLRAPALCRAAAIAVAVVAFIAPTIRPVIAQTESDHAEKSARESVPLVIAPRPRISFLAPIAGLGTPVTRAPAADSLPARQSPVARRHRGAMVFYGLVAAGTLAAFELRIDPDDGGYEDGWQTKAPFPDKIVHALASFALTSVGVDVGARPWLAATTVCAAGAAFEYSQGYVSYMDISANCIGAAGAAFWKSWTKHRDDGAVR